LLRSDGTENSLKDSRLPRPNLTGARLLREFSVPLFLTKLVLNCVINDCILELTALDLALPPAKRFSAFVVSSKEGFNGLAPSSSLVLKLPPLSVLRCSRLNTISI